MLFDLLVCDSHLFWGHNHHSEILQIVEAWPPFVIFMKFGVCTYKLDSETEYDLWQNSTQQPAEIFKTIFAILWERIKTHDQIMHAAKYWTAGIIYTVQNDYQHDTR